MENFTPGTMEALGLGYDVLGQRNPRLIYAATSGFGQTGPERLRPALDVVVQGMGGIMSITGEPDGPPVRPGASLGDITAGLFTAIGVLAALQERERSGRGQMVDVSMLDCQISILENAFVRYFATGEVPKALGTRHPLSTPFQAFPTKDGYIVLALSWGVENQWELYCATIGLLDLIDDPRFDTPALRTEHHAELEPMLNEAMRRKTTAEWLREFDAIGLPCGPLNNIAQSAEQPQVKARGMLTPVRASDDRRAAAARHAGEALADAGRHRRPIAGTGRADGGGADRPAGSRRRGDRGASPERRHLTGRGTLARNLRNFSKYLLTSK